MSWVKIALAVGGAVKDKSDTAKKGDWQSANTKSEADNIVKNIISSAAAEKASAPDQKFSGSTSDGPGVNVGGTNAAGEPMTYADGSGSAPMPSASPSVSIPAPSSSGGFMSGVGNVAKGAADMVGGLVAGSVEKKTGYNFMDDLEKRKTKAETEVLKHKILLNAAKQGMSPDAIDVLGSVKADSPEKLTTAMTGVQSFFENKAVLVQQQEANKRSNYMLQQGLMPVSMDKATTFDSATGTAYAPLPNFTPQSQTIHQDSLANQAMQRISSARGDASLVRTELQRDAAAQGYNTLTKAESEKRPLSQLEYYDTLGQMWRAKTGTAPTVESMSSIDGKTVEQKLNNFGTFITGKPMAANSPAMISNLKSYIQDTGEQLDRSHDAYMAPHTIKPPGLSDEAWAPIAASARGLSFKDATDLVTIKSSTGKIKRVSRKQAKELGAM